ncbi:MAG: hypothetical protein LBC73_05620, partial [Oscillospiraceae bacterium]|nr:hypothetical protein [Oscillospiraceae bacterium]
MLKYTFKNLLKTIKFYIPLLLILATVLLFLLFSLGTRENTIASNQEYLGKYAAVGIVGRSSNNYMIDEEFIDRFYSSEFTKDYYAFSEFSIGSDMLISTPYTLTVEYEDSVGWGNIVTPEGRVAGINPNFLFTWLVYSDIEKSTHFWLDDRRIIEGRFAENTRECNISIDLAELNGLVLGDEITFYLNYIRSEKITLEIVGIFEDNTEKIINEAVLVEPVSILANRDGIKSVWYGQYVSQNNLSRNQILSVAQTSDELIALNLSDGMAVTEYGYNAVLYYTYDENSVIKYVDWIESMLSNRFVVLDSIAQLRIMSIFYSNVENSVNWLLTIATLICLVLCTLILFFVLKSRIYDIGVFRTRGMPR